jgi:hypothetical protein
MTWREMSASPYERDTTGHQFSQSQAKGRAVQVDPVKPKLKPPGTKRLKPKCHVLLLSYAFKFNLRRYI